MSATTRLAVRSLAQRRTSFAASAVGAFIGAAAIGSFATVAAAAAGPASGTDRQTLATLGAVVGAAGALIVLFSIVSTVGITVRQRHEEIGLLRTVGASPEQVRSLVRREAGAVLAFGAVLGALVAVPAGRLLLAGVRDSGLVSGGVHLPDGALGSALGVAAPAGAALLVVAVGVLAAGIAVRRASRDSALHALSAGRSGMSRMRPWRWVVALVCVGHATTMAIMTVTTDSADPYDAMATSGSLSIVVGVGIAAIGPVLLRAGARLLRPIVGRDAAAFLARFNAERRADVLAAVFGPVVVLTSSAVGTLVLLGIDARTGPATLNADQRPVTLLNYVVVGMLVVFAAISVVNALAAATTARRVEFGRLTLLGAEPAVVRDSVGREARIVAVAGVIYGLVASLATTVPFGIARGEGVVPDGQLWLPPLVLIAVVALTGLAARAVVSRVRFSPLTR